MRALIMAVTLLVHLMSPVESIAQETYENRALGFTATKPADWHNLNAKQYKENLSKIDNTKLKTFALRYAKAPFFAITKYDQTTYADLNPSVQVKTRAPESASGSPISSLRLTAQMVPTLFKRPVINEGPVETTISGKRAAYMRVSFTAELRGMSAEATSELWIVAHEDIYLIISASTRKDEANGTRAEIRKIVESIKLE